MNINKYIQVPTSIPRMNGKRTEEERMGGRGKRRMGEEKGREGRLEKERRVRIGRRGEGGNRPEEEENIR